LLQTSQGNWSNAPTSYTYQWERCDGTGANCNSIPGAMASGYVPSSTDVTLTLRVTVTASNSSGGTPATSSQSAAVLIAAPANTTLPTVSGQAVQAQLLSASTGNWENSPGGYSYQWLSCDYSGASCAPIMGANSSGYTPTVTDAGDTLRVTVTASNAGGQTSATSAQTEAVLGLQASTTNQPPPVFDSSTNLNPVSGTILVKLPGSSTFTPLQIGTDVPIGSTIDATHGTVSITVALPGGGTQTGQFYDGEFTLTQSPSGTTIPILTGGSFTGCPAPNSATTHGRASIAASNKKKTTVVRQLWGSAHGNYTTKGRYGSASVSGTIWLVQDRCDGTYIEVTKDDVFVIAYTHPHHRYHILQGHHILIAAPGF
jgi:hypothetical protein